MDTEAIKRDSAPSSQSLAQRAEINNDLNASGFGLPSSPFYFFQQQGLPLLWGPLPWDSGGADSSFTILEMRKRSLSKFDEEIQTWGKFSVISKWPAQGHTAGESQSQNLKASSNYFNFRVHLLDHYAALTLY